MPTQGLFFGFRGKKIINKHLRISNQPLELLRERFGNVKMKNKMFGDVKKFFF